MSVIGNEWNMIIYIPQYIKSYKHILVNNKVYNNNHYSNWLKFVVSDQHLIVHQHQKACSAPSHYLNQC